MYMQTTAHFEEFWVANWGEEQSVRGGVRK